ncbi:MAG: U32 family peptidase, partial [Clostridia bacterium]|nr:U32 family peptidase [Clostridia bacterium]
MTKKKLPELLAPAGSYDAFVAALSSGADAVYLGLGSHNARVGAKNFTMEDLKRALDEAHLRSRKIYLTFNTLLNDRELEEVLDEVYTLANMGVDAFIVQDLGLLSAIANTIPSAELHASTQCITHSLDGVRALHALGASRAVVARELDRENLSHICRESSIEIEAFVHGALCVCHSGACLFSSLVGGRSGNRGECAQPCRLPYKARGFGGQYPLSLRDSSLAEHLTEMTDMGVASLKIEGRMKSPEYVGSVVKIYRELLDAGRDASESDMKALARIFSRGGLTDGYYERRLGAEMLGIRAKEDKEETRAAERETEAFVLPKVPLKASLDVTQNRAVLTYEGGERRASVESTEVSPALTQPITEETAFAQVSRLGNTPFELCDFSFSTDGNYMLPKSVINAMRRECVDAIMKREEKTLERLPLEELQEKAGTDTKTSVFIAPHRRIEKKEIEAILSLGIDRIYLPLFSDIDVNCPEKIGVTLPTVIFDSQRAGVLERLREWQRAGVTKAMAESLGSFVLAKDAGFDVLAGTRMNVYNSRTGAVMGTLGAEGTILSAELTANIKRRILSPLPVGEVIYGRAPLMLLENCLMNLRDGCRETCDGTHCSKGMTLVDRKNVTFPVFAEYFHRCQIYNSVPTFN